MYFYMPVKVYQEMDAVKNHADEFARFGRKALIITGSHSSKENGSLQDVEDALQEQEIPYDVYDQIKENPTVEQIMEAATLGRKKGSDFVIGIGGGSPMDAAKAVAVMVENRDSDASVLYEHLDLRALPVVCVPTTCGTGSEVTQYAVLTRTKKNTKQSMFHYVFPDVALIDPEYLINVPHQILVNTAVDALGHFLESYFNVNATEYSKMICRQGMLVWQKNKAVLEGKKQDITDCGNLFTASSMAGMAIAHTSTTVPHGLSYHLTCSHGMAHGKAVGYFLPGYLKALPDTFVQERNEVLSLLGFESLDDFTGYIQKLLGSFSLSEEEVQKIVEEMGSNEKKMKALPYSATEKDLLTMMELVRA